MLQYSASAVPSSVIGPQRPPRVADTTPAVGPGQPRPTAGCATPAVAGRAGRTVKRKQVRGAVTITG
jgi:hypothetical protein